MEVTRKNFVKVFNIFKTKLKKADFVSIDGEFTGLSTLRAPRFTYDTLEEKYKKAKDGSDNFMIIQFGICLFTWNHTNKCYVAFPFTFYVFPRPYKRNFNDVMFTCQSSSLDFLANNGFDFNKMLYEGISFMHPTTEKKAKEKLDESLKFFARKQEKANTNQKEVSQTTAEKPKTETTVFVPKDQREFINEVVSTVQIFLQDTSKDTCDLPPCNPFQRKLIYEVIEEKYPMGVYLKSEVNEEKKKYIKVFKVTEKGSKERNHEEEQKEIDLFDEAVGFTKVMRLLSEEKKPIVGHNMFLDLFYSITNFFADAPDDLMEFKSLVSDLFPYVFDTKLMATTQPLSKNVTRTSLQQLTEAIGSELPSIEIMLDEESMVDNENKGTADFHDAGFDAFSTGRCFVSLMNCLTIHLELPVGPIDLFGKLIEPFKNRIYIMGIQDIRYMNFAKADKPPNRRGIFFVNFPSNWNAEELHNLFSPICKLNYPITWVNSSSAYVALSDKDKHDIVMERFVMNTNNSDLFQIVPFKEQLIPVEKADTNESLKRKHSDSEIEDGEISSADEGILDDKETENIIAPKKQKTLFQVSSEW